MEVSKICPASANQSITRINKSVLPSFGVKLSFSREASKYMAETAHKVGRESAGGDSILAGVYGQHIANALDANINRLAEVLETIKPNDYPVTLDLTEECKRHFTTKGTIEGFDKYMHDEFELCPRGIHQTGKPYIASFNLNLGLLSEQFERLYYVVIDRLEHGLWR